MDYNNLINDLDHGKITPYQIYNLDVDYSQYFAIDHYLKNIDDSIDQNQKLHKIFFDIEVFSDNKFNFDNIETGEHPISSCTLLSNFEKKIYCFFLLINKNVEVWKQHSDIKEYLKKKLKDEEYGDYEIELNTFTNDLPLLKAFWSKIHELDPAVITGFNSDRFDLPYIYFRLKNLYNGDTKAVSKVFSKFSNVSISKLGNGFKLRLIEYINADFSYLYRPREDGGLGLGSKQPSYSLNFISEIELKRTKVDYKKDDINLDTFYVQDPVNYLFYNIIDVWLVDQLENKMKIIDQFNMYRRLMRTPMDIALRGPTVLFDTLVYNQLSKDKKYIRFGINDETILSISKEEIDKIPKPLSSRKIKWNITNIDERTYLKITRKFEGAYVKNSPGRIYDADDGLILDLDASSLYPSMIRQSNVSFDTYHGRIFDPITTTKAFDLIDTLLKDRKPDIIKIIHGNFFELIIKYIESDKITVTNMNETIQQYYFVISYLFGKIINSKVNNIKEILHPSDYYQYILLKKYFIPLMNLIDEIHENNNEYNTFSYDYLLNNEMNYKSIYIIEDINKSSIQINQVLSETLKEYLKKNQLILTLTGCLFYKHEKLMSIFSSWLESMAQLRKQYKKKRNEFDKNSDDYSFYDSRQLATKVAMNTSYGLYGQSTFRYSNNWLAKTITTQGRLALKISQQVAEDYLKKFKEN
jgi:DNA polymerase elongation subunit (family B)